MPRPETPGALGRRQLLLAAAIAVAHPSLARTATLAFAPLVSGVDGAEGIAVAGDGGLYLSSANGVLRWSADGGLTAVAKTGPVAGIALDADGRILAAVMGLLHDEPGPLLRIDPESGAVETLVAELGGRRLLASNMPAVASDGGIYCTHSAWGNVRNIGRTDTEGFVYHYRNGRADIVAAGLRGPNGCCLSADQRHFYVALTGEGRVRRWKREADGHLHTPEDYGPVLGDVVPDHHIDAIRALPAAARGRLGYCDGLAFDAAGNLWVTLPFADRLVAITPERTLVEMARDPEGKAIAMPTNLAWGGADLRDLYLVSRGTGTIAVARTKTPGIPLHKPLGGQQAQAPASNSASMRK